GKIKMLPKLADLGSIFPTSVRTGPCKEVIETTAPSLASLPILKCWPQDAGRYITMGCVFTKSPSSGKRNCGMYRLQAFDERTLGFHSQIHKHGAQHQREAEGRASRIEVAVAIGPDPAVTFAAIVLLPGDLDDMLGAGFIRS